jgi:hypothetical protein
MRGPGKFLDKESPIQGPWCRIRREARARATSTLQVVDSLKVLNPQRPIREADIGAASFDKSRQSLLKNSKARHQAIHARRRDAI